MAQTNTKPAAGVAASAATAGMAAARVATGTVVSQQTHQYLTFVLSGEVFAMGILSIKEIIEYASLTEVPMMPAYVRGVINLRGSVVPVIDLSMRFGKPASPVTKRTCIVIIEIIANGERQVLGVVVDAVNAVLDIPTTEVEPPPAFGASIRTDFIQGMGKVNGKFIILLDVDHVLAADEMSVLTEAQASANQAA